MAFYKFFWLFFCLFLHSTMLLSFFAFSLFLPPKLRNREIKLSWTKFLDFGIHDPSWDLNKFPGDSWSWRATSKDYPRTFASKPRSRIVIGLERWPDERLDVIKSPPNFWSKSCPFNVWSVKLLKKLQEVLGIRGMGNRIQFLVSGPQW